MKNSTPIFRGIATALITPLTADGIDYAQFGKLIDWQIDQGINALVICGTTGESSTLSDAEHRRAIAFACERVNGRVPVIAGTGSNETAYAVELTKSACADGADAVLVVTPYYNKTTQNGLVAMYNTIADASTKPVILYNVPSRTGIGIQPETYVKLAQHPNIAAIKEANSDISKIVETFALVGDPAGHLLRQRRPDRPHPLHGGTGVHLRALQRGAPGDGGHHRPVLRRERGGGRPAAVQVHAPDPLPVLREQPHPREGRHGRPGLL